MIFIKTQENTTRKQRLEIDFTVKYSVIDLIKVCFMWRKNKAADFFFPVYLTWGKTSFDIVKSCPTFIHSPQRVFQSIHHFSPLLWKKVTLPTLNASVLSSFCCTLQQNHCAQWVICILSDKAATVSYRLRSSFWPYSHIHVFQQE